MKKRNTPQEKKALSLKKDRRNLYGENDKASRKAIPLRKRKVNRQNRKKTNDTISGMPRVTTVDELDTMDDRLLKERPKEWKKEPDSPLAEAIEHSQRWSILRAERKRTGILDVDDPQLDEIN